MSSRALLLVGVALTDERVQAGTHVVECIDPDTTWTWQFCKDWNGDRLFLRFWNVDEWEPWDAHRYILPIARFAAPCRILAYADANGDPRTRGPIVPPPEPPSDAAQRFSLLELD